MNQLVLHVFLLILDLQEINFCIIYSYRTTGIKFSIRSGEPEVLDAGAISYDALSSLNGNGGGHATMAGGFLSYNELKQTGASKDHWDGIIEEAFLNYLKKKDNI